MTLFRRLLAGLGLTCLGVACEDPPKPVTSAPAPPPLAHAAISSAAVAQTASPLASVRKTLAQCGVGSDAALTQPGMDAEVRRKLKQPSGTISLAELSKLRSLNLSNAARTHELDLCTFSHLNNLKDLFLGVGDYDDLSPLAGLRELESLSAPGSAVKDASPLSKLSKLDRLDLSHTGITDVSPLAALTSLTELTLDDTSISDVSPLAKLSKLEKLGLQHTQVKDLSVLKPLKKLKVLYVAGTPADEEGLTLAPLRANGTKVID